MSSKQQLMAQIQAGRWPEARETGRELCRLHANDAEAWFLLGAIHGQMDDWEDAEACSEKAATLAPGVSAAHFNLGVARLRLRKPGAAASLRTTIALQPDHPAARDLLKEACFVEGLMLTQAGNPEGARQFLTSALSDADCAKTRMLLGEIYSKADRPDDAATHYRRACELDPADAVAHACAADAMLLGDSSLRTRLEALEYFRTAVRLDPGYIAARNNLAGVLKLLGFHEEALAEYANVLEISPGHPTAILGIVRTHDAAGQWDKAEEILRPWIGESSTSPEIALALATVASHLGERKTAIESLRAVMASGQCDRETEKTACFHLGDLHDAEGMYAEAFQYYERGNSLRAAAYDRAEQAKRYSAIIGAFAADRIKKYPRAANRSKLPVFIVGMPRSGTTLIESILASHPEVYGAGELDDIFLLRQGIAAASGTGLPYPDCLDKISAETLGRLAEGHLKNLTRLGGDAARVTDKMPQNFSQLGLIDLLFPGARVIHCQRDPLDTCLSIYCHPFTPQHNYADNLSNLGHYYREYLRVMAHWRKVLRIPLLELRYEELVENPEEQARRLLEFCELPWDERCLRHHESGRFANTFSYNQVRRPIYKSSVARWKRYEKHLGPLMDALGDAREPRQDAGAS